MRYFLKREFSFIEVSLFLGFLFLTIVPCSANDNNDIPFLIKGVCYQPVPIGMRVEDWNDSPYPAELCERDMPLLAQMGVNTIRTWDNASPALMTTAQQHSIKVAIGFWIPYDADLEDDDVREQLKTDFRERVQQFKGYSALLMWCIGNENNLWGTSPVEYFYSLANEMGQDVREEEGVNYHPVCIVNGEIDDIPLDYQVPYIDIWGVNMYRGISFDNLFTEYQSKSSKPMWITEFGCDAYYTNPPLPEENYGQPEHGGYEDEAAQKEYHIALWTEIAQAYRENKCMGGAVMTFTDEWWKPGWPFSPWADCNTHDTDGFLNSSAPDGFFNEEYWGIFKCVDNGSSTDILEPREIFYYMFTESGIPQPSLDIWTNQTAYQGGDEFILTLNIQNPLSSDKNVDLYIVLEVAGQYWYYPSWRQAPADYVNITLPSGFNETAEIINFNWPDNAGSGLGMFHAALLDKETQEVLSQETISFQWSDSGSYDWQDGPPWVYEAELNITYYSSAIILGDPITITVEATNIGTATWTNAQPNPIHCRTHGYKPNGECIWDLVTYGGALTCDVNPGETYTFNLSIPTGKGTQINKPGQYMIEDDMVRESMFWFNNVVGVGVEIRCPPISKVIKK